MISTAQANDKKQPAMNEEKKILSMRMFALATPAREHSSTVSLGEYELWTTLTAIVLLDEVVELERKEGD